MSPVCREARGSEIPSHSYFANKTSVAFTWETGWPGSVGSHCQLPRSRRQTAGQTFSHVNTPSRRGGTKKIITAHAFVYQLHRWRGKQVVSIKTRDKDKNCISKIQENLKESLFIFRKSMILLIYNKEVIFIG